MSKLIYIAGNYPLKEVRDPHSKRMSVNPFEEKWEDILTKKTYCASLDWTYTKWHAAQVISYIKDYLQHTDEAEIWNIWMGTSYPPPLIKKITISADELTPELLKKIDDMGNGQQLSLYKGYIPKEWDISEEELEPDIQFCFVVRSGQV